MKKDHMFTIEDKQENKETNQSEHHVSSHDVLNTVKAVLG